MKHKLLTRMLSSAIFGFISVSIVAATVHDSNRDLTEIVLDEDLNDRMITINSGDRSYQIGVDFTLTNTEEWSKREYNISIGILNIDCKLGTSDIHLNLAVNGTTKRIWSCDETGTSRVDLLHGESSYLITSGGNWIDSKVQILATMYFETDVCPSDYGFFGCNWDTNTEFQEDGVANENLNRGYKRPCYSNALIGKGRPNCGMSCDFCRSNEIPCYEDSYYGNNKGYYDMQYMLTILLAGLFFILSPVVIVIILFYRRRVNTTQRQRTEHDEARNSNRNRRAHHYPQNDHPPTYDDVHGTKDPPPSFAVAINMSQGTEEPETSQDITHDSPIQKTGLYVQG